ncbi:hypothetical protein ACFX4I_14780 [Peribacillus sp. YIM B13472]|uniref:hypothetical protein n=1 Tax=Peribacillus sp. YIM B13472 TaxID=3366297 RepID=UPI00366FDE06
MRKMIAKIFSNYLYGDDGCFNQENADKIGFKILLVLLLNPKRAKQWYEETREETRKEKEKENILNHLVNTILLTDDFLNIGFNHLKIGNSNTKIINHMQILISLYSSRIELEWVDLEWIDKDNFFDLCSIEGEIEQIEEEIVRLYKALNIQDRAS